MGWGSLPLRIAAADGGCFCCCAVRADDFRDCKSSDDDDGVVDDDADADADADALSSSCCSIEWCA